MFTSLSSTAPLTPIPQPPWTKRECVGKRAYPSLATLCLNLTLPRLRSTTSSLTTDISASSLTGVSSPSLTKPFPPQKQSKSSYPHSGSRYPYPSPRYFNFTSTYSRTQGFFIGTWSLTTPPSISASSPKTPSEAPRVMISALTDPSGAFPHSFQMELTLGSKPLGR